MLKPLNNTEQTLRLRVVALVCHREVVALAVCLLFDERTDHALRQLWHRLAGAGAVVVSRHRHAHGHPQAA